MSLVEVLVASGLLGALTLYIATNNKYMNQSARNYDTSVSITDFNRNIMNILNHPASCNATINANQTLFNTVFNSAVGSNTAANNFSFMSVEGDDPNTPPSTFAELGEDIEDRFILNGLNIIKESDTKLNFQIRYDKKGTPLGPKSSSKVFSIVLNNNSGVMTCLGVEDLSNFKEKFAQLCEFLGGVVNTAGECRCANGQPLAAEEVVSGSGCQDAYSLVEDEVQAEIVSHYNTVIDPRLDNHDAILTNHEARISSNSSWITVNAPIVAANKTRSESNSSWIAANSPIITANTSRSQNNRSVLSSMSGGCSGGKILAGYNIGTSSASPICIDPPSGSTTTNTNTNTTNNPNINIGNANCPQGEYLSGISANGNTISVQCSSMNVACPSGQVLTGISNGSAVCEDRSIASTPSSGPPSGNTCSPKGGSCTTQADCCALNCPSGSTPSVPRYFCNAGQCTDETTSPNGFPMIGAYCQLANTPTGPSTNPGPGPGPLGP